MDIQAGTYRGKIVNYGVQETKNGDPQVVVAFGTSEPERTTLYWRGSFNGGARPITIKALMTMGVTRPQDLDRIAEGPAGGALDTKKEFDLVVELETYEGKTQPKVRWVNNAGGTIQNSIDKSKFSQKLRGLGDFSRDFTEAQQRGRKGQESSHGFDGSDIPPPRDGEW